MPRKIDVRAVEEYPTGTRAGASVAEMGGSVYTIPKELITEWDTVKKGLPAAIDKIKTSRMISAEAKKQIKAKAVTLIGEFDGNLKKKMRVAASAKTEADAQRAAARVSEVVAEYRQTIQKYKAEWGPTNIAIIDRLDRVLVKIAQHAEASQKSRPPLQVPPDLRTAFDSGMRAAMEDVAEIAGPTDDDDLIAIEKAARKFVDTTVRVRLAGPVNHVYQADSDDELRERLTNLITAVERVTADVTSFVRQKGEGTTELSRTLALMLSKMTSAAKKVQAQVG